MSKNNSRISPLLLVELLESFSKKELDGLKHIASCVYFNTDKYVIKLLDVLRKSILGKDWTQEAAQIRLFNKLYTNSLSDVKTLDKKQRAKLSDKMSLLTRLAERFLRMEALEKSQSNRCEMLMESLLEKKQYRLFNKHLVKERKAIEKDTKDFFYFMRLHLLEEKEFLFLMNTGKWVKSNNVDSVISSLDLKYLYEKLNYSIAKHEIKVQNSLNPLISPIPELIETEVFKNCGYRKYPIFTLQLAALELISNAKYSSYCNLVKLLKRNELMISRDYLMQFYTIAVNFCTHQIKKGKIEYFKYYVDLYKLLDNKQLLIINNSIPIRILINIVTIGCKANDFEWVLTMIEKYTPFINARHKDNVMNYNLGYVAFEKGDYEEATYYELEQHYTEPTAQLFRSLETFIKSHKLLSNKDKIMYKTFIRIFYNLYRIKHWVGTIKLDKLKDRINNAEFISNKLWLLEKIEELEKLSARN